MKAVDQSILGACDVCFEAHLFVLPYTGGKKPHSSSFDGRWAPPAARFFTPRDPRGLPLRLGAKDPSEEMGTTLTRDLAAALAESDFEGAFSAASWAAATTPGVFDDPAGTSGPSAVFLGLPRGLPVPALTRTLFAGVLAPSDAPSARVLALSCFLLILAATLARSRFAASPEVGRRTLPAAPGAAAAGAFSTAAPGALPLERDLAAGSADCCLGSGDGYRAVLAKDTERLDRLRLGSPTGAIKPAEG